MLAVAAGIAADWFLGEPPEGWHPVVGFGRTMEWLERRCYADSRLRGLLYAGLGTALAAGAGAALSGQVGSRRLAGRRQPPPGAGPGSARQMVALAAATYTAVAGRALATAAGDVAVPLDAGDLTAARARLPALVGRDTEGLGEADIARAVVESVAENTVDAVVAPALWAALAGPAGVLAYRAVNTLDAMVGHRSDRYSRFGWAAARADDVAAWVPARLTAALVILVRPRAAGPVLAAVRGQAPAHPSPNAGVAEAAFAAALGVRLGGCNTYGGRPDCRPTLGSGAPPSRRDIARAVRLSRDVTAAGTVIALLLACRGGRS
jgi:adenosylcobinamide-phosphate synthase